MMVSRIGKGNKKTNRGLNDNRFGNFLLLGTDKNRIRNVVIGKYLNKVCSGWTLGLQIAERTDAKAVIAHEEKMKKDL